MLLPSIIIFIYKIRRSKGYFLIIPKIRAFFREDLEKSTEKRMRTDKISRDIEPFAFVFLLALKSMLDGALFINFFLVQKKL
jgi:hypothetical protein